MSKKRQLKPKPGDITRELAEKICALVKAGLTVYEAAGAAGVSEYQVDSWRERGALVKTGPYAAFVLQLKGAKAARRGNLAAKVANQTGQSLAAARYLLERIEPEQERPKAPIGRPSKLTRALLDEIHQHVLNGCNRQVACHSVGLEQATVSNWRQQGDADLSEGKQTLAAEFSMIVRKADALSESAMWRDVARGRRSRREDHGAKLALQALNSRFWQKYRPGRGMAQTVRVEAPEGPRTEVTVNVVQNPASTLPPDKFQQLRRLMLEARGVEVAEPEPEESPPAPADGQ